MTKKEERQKIYNKTGGYCYYCGKELKTRWQIDHVRPVIRNLYTGKMEEKENDNFNNKVPACPRCNRWKASTSIDAFRQVIDNLITVLNRDSSQYRMAKDYGLVKETGQEVVFYFENKNPRKKEGLYQWLSAGEVRELANALYFMENHILSDTRSHSNKINIRNIIKKLNL